jgi:hypothetical protein
LISQRRKPPGAQPQERIETVFRRNRKKPKPSFVQLPSQTVLSKEQMELALKTVDEGLSPSPDLWSISPPEELQHLSPEDWMLVSAILDGLIQQRAMSSLH